MLTSAVYREETGKWVDDQKVFLDTPGNIIWPSVILDAQGVPFSTANRMPTDANLQQGDVDVSASNPVWTADFLVEVAKGNIPGHSVVHKFGLNPNIPNSTDFSTIWSGGGLYPGQNPVVADTIEVFSASANDVGTLRSSGTATGGSTTTIEDTEATFLTDVVVVGDVIVNDTDQEHGIVRTVTSETVLTVRRFQGGMVPVAGDSYRVIGKASTGCPVVKLNRLFDIEYDTTTEYIMMAGLSPVETVGQYIRLSRARCHGGNAEGDITARQKSTPANIFMEMPSSQNATMLALDTVPRGQTGFFVNWYGSLSGKTQANSSIRIRAKHVGDVYQTQEQQGSLRATGSSYLPVSFEIPKGPYPEMTDISIEANSDTIDTSIAAGYTMLFVENGLCAINVMKSKGKMWNGF